MTLWSIMRVLASLVVLSIIGGCSSPPQRMEMFPSAAMEDQQRVWPGPPQVPRYRYAGQLLGEVNFERAPGAVSAGQRALRWIVGAGRRTREAQMLVRPQGGMVDAAGRILVTDVGRQAVFVFDPDAGLSVWDQADGGENFVSPLGITAGPSDEIYVADAELARIVRLDAKGSPIGSFRIPAETIEVPPPPPMPIIPAISSRVVTNRSKAAIMPATAGPRSVCDRMSTSPRAATSSASARLVALPPGTKGTPAARA